MTATQRVFGAAEEARKLFGAEDKDEIVFGPSSTANVENLARGLEGDIKEGDEFIITGEHEGLLHPVLLNLRSHYPSELWAMEKARGAARGCDQVLAFHADEPKQPVLAQSQGGGAAASDLSQDPHRGVHRDLQSPRIGCSSPGDHQGRTG